VLDASRALIDAYPVRGWWPARSRFEIMAGAILVQHTRWTGVQEALSHMRRDDCLSADKLTACPVDRLAGLIRPAGCQRIKARRLRSLAAWVTAAGGLRRVARLDTGTLRGALLDVHGIGPETADAILCFAFQRPVFVADQYARRWLARLGEVAPELSGDYESVRAHAEQALAFDGREFQNLHAAIVLHGQGRCATIPDCRGCMAGKFCKKYI